MTDAAIFVLSLGGFAALLLAMPRHQGDWLGLKLSPHVGRILRLAGFAALALAFLVAGTGFGWGYGTVAWFGWLTIAATLVVTVHTNRDRIMRKARR
ncbi:MAG: DUF3325 domain-containing protein [Sphingobium sp.]